MPPIAVALVLSVVAFGIGTSYPVGTVSIQNAVSRYQVGAAMGAMNFFRGLTAVFIVAAMGAIVLAGLGVAIERGGAPLRDRDRGRARASIWRTSSAACSRSGCCA